VNSYSLPVLKIDESFLRKSLEENPPSITDIEMALLSAKLEVSSVKDKFNSTLTGSASYMKTNELPFAAFIPVTSPITTGQLGINKMTESGIQLGVKGFTEQITNNFTNRGTTTGLSISAGVDIWKDLIKQRSSSQIGNANQNLEIAKLQTVIAKKTFLNSLRKVYWALVSNEESLKISRKLLESSKKQVQQAKRRLANKVADKGEVARYESQYSSRKSSIISLQYQKEGLIRNLKELLPHIATRNIDLAPYSISDTVQTVLACTSLIATQTGLPKDFTLYDEIIEGIKKQEKIEMKINSSYSAPEVILQSEFGIKGREFSYSDSVSDLSDNRYKNYAIGLQVNIPLDSRKKTTEEILQEVSKRKMRARSHREMARIQSFHTQTVRQISFLQEIIRNQRNNTKFLSQSLKSSQKKYNQARLTVQQLVNEQDAYLNSNLDEIQTNLTTINTLLDYLSVYTETPCKLNRI
jgi:outer membrane protein TolC